MQPGSERIRQIRYTHIGLCAYKNHFLHYIPYHIFRQTNQIHESNFSLLAFPYYPIIVDQYFNRDMDPVDFYADLLSYNIYKKKRVLISLYELHFKHVRFKINICSI